MIGAVKAISLGTIPACAGSRAALVSGSTMLRDHPRVRGEQDLGDPRGPHTAGPSPRARGAVSATPMIGGVTGTIPACAGSRRKHPGIYDPAWDHPRVRGEQCSWGKSSPWSSGPSPRARGAAVRRVRDQRRAGTIPACAGSRLAELGTYQRQAAEFPTSRETDIPPTKPSPIQPMIPHRPTRSPCRTGTRSASRPEPGSHTPATPPMTCGWPLGSSPSNGNSTTGTYRPTASPPYSSL